MNNIVDRIDEVINKPSFEEFFFNRKNYNMIKKVFDRYQSEYANEYGQDMLGDEQYYSEEDLEEMEVSPDEAYDNFAHTQGYMAEYDAAYSTIEKFKNKYSYKRKDEDDQEKQTDIIILCGYTYDFMGNRSHQKEVKEKVKKYSK